MARSRELSTYCVETLECLSVGPMTTFGTEPVCISRLVEEGLAETYRGKAPAHWAKTEMTTWLKITDGGREYLAKKGRLVA